MGNGLVSKNRNPDERNPPEKRPKPDILKNTAKGMEQSNPHEQKSSNGQRQNIYANDELVVKTETNQER